MDLITFVFMKSESFFAIAFLFLTLKIGVDWI